MNSKAFEKKADLNMYLKEVTLNVVKYRKFIMLLLLMTGLYGNFKE